MRAQPPDAYIIDNVRVNEFPTGKEAEALSKSACRP